MNRITIVLVIAGLIILLGSSYLLAPKLMSTTYESVPAVAIATSSQEVSVVEEIKVKPDLRPTVSHVPLPDSLRAIYMTSCVVGTPSFRDSLVALVERTEINSIIIDIKDFSGTISFPPTSTNPWYPAWQNSGCGTRDMKEFIATLHEKGIFAIGRLTVFQDPFYTSVRPDLAVKRADGVTVWKDHKGLSFIDVAATEYWDHIIELTRLSYNIGFDELNYDYVRYPSDGPMNDISFVHSAAGEYGDDKQANLEAFFQYLEGKVSDPSLYDDVRHENTGRATNIPYMSADLFGMTTTNYDDLSIGQIQERAAPYFDAIAPMVYPSHYPGSFLGLGNPNDYPYKIVNYAMQAGVDRMIASTTTLEGFMHEPLDPLSTSTPVIYTKPVYTADRLRTWIQDFDYGGDYDAADVRAQIQASYDAGVDSWMIWAPSNIYTEAALLPAITISTTTAQ